MFDALQLSKPLFPKLVFVKTHDYGTERSVLDITENTETKT